MEVKLEVIHIVPVNDIEQHYLRGNCHCNPGLVFSKCDKMQYVHQAFDQREAFDEEAGDGWFSVNSNGEAL